MAAALNVTGEIIKCVPFGTYSGTCVLLQGKKKVDTLSKDHVFSLLLSQEITGMFGM